MTSLPISSNKPQTSGNAANTSQANSAADAQLADMQSTEPFAFLLARQISETDLPALTAAQTAIATDGKAASGSADRTLKDAQDQAAAATDTTGDPANTLAAILLQLPTPENRGEKAEGMQTTQPISSFQRTKDKQVMQPFISGSSQEAVHKRPTAGSEDSQIIQLPAIDHLPSEATKHAELPSGLPQPVPKITQAIASPVTLTAMPSMITNNIPAVISPTISTPLGNNGWADEFSQKISWISTQKNQVAELHLNPPNLGPLDVVLKISDNQATVLFTSPHGAVRDAVENALPKLREILADNGIMLGNTTISDQPPRDRNMDGFMNQGSGTAAQREVFGTAVEVGGLLSVDTQAAPVRRHNGMVDTFA